MESIQLSNNNCTSEMPELTRAEVRFEKTYFTPKQCPLLYRYRLKAQVPNCLNSAALGRLPY